MNIWAYVFSFFIQQEVVYDTLWFWKASDSEKILERAAYLAPVI